MIIQKLKFQNHRNLENSEILPDKNINIIFGNNAQGKTNLLEGIWLFTGGKSFRNAKDNDLLKFNTQQSKLELDFLSDEKRYLIEIMLSQKGRRITINGVSSYLNADLIGKFCAVVFSPTHLDLIKGGPTERRRFLDTAICQAEPLYAKSLIKYSHILSQRNTLLKDIKNHPELLDTLDIWNEKLADLATIIILKRKKYSDYINQIAKENYIKIAKEKETLDIKYITNTANNLNQYFLVEQIKEKLKKTQKEDLFLGFTTTGPHRDDLLIQINEKSAKKFSSQGQQRSAILAMKLSEAAVLNKICKKNPVILLDDVLSELDKTRQDFILNSISTAQTFITCCEKDQVSKLKNGKLFLVNNGMITQK